MIMGCSTSSPAVTDANKERTLSANKINEKTNNSNMDGQSNSIGNSNAGKDTNKYPASEAFIIPLNDDAEPKVYNASAPEVNDVLAATIKKQPPKRIQELLEQAAESDTTGANLQDLEEKLEKAEERRKEYLQQKITNIQKTTQMLMESGGFNELVEREKDAEREVVEQQMAKSSDTDRSTTAEKK